MYTPNICYTSFCIQHCSLKTTLHITLVVLDNTRPIWSTFLSVLLLKFWTSSHCRAHFSSVNTLSKIGRPDYHGIFIPLCSIMEICWITTLHIQSITQSDCFDPRIPNILETRIIWIYAVLITSPARDCSPWIPAVFGLSPVTARMGLAEHAFTHYQLTNYKQGVWEHSHNLTGDENSTIFILK